MFVFGVILEGSNSANLGGIAKEALSVFVMVFKDDSMYVKDMMVWIIGCVFEFVYMDEYLMVDV